MAYDPHEVELIRDEWQNVPKLRPTWSEAFAIVENTQESQDRRIAAVMTLDLWWGDDADGLTTENLRRDLRWLDTMRKIVDVEHSLGRAVALALYAAKQCELSGMAWDAVEGFEILLKRIDDARVTLCAVLSEWEQYDLDAKAA